MKIATFDIETTNLNANMGRILCASFHDLQTGATFTLRGDKKPYKVKDKLNDARLACAIRDVIKKYNLIVTWNGKLFDAPFLNARLLKAGSEDSNPQMHLDLMYFASGNSSKVGTMRMDGVAKFFKVNHQKTELNYDVWQGANIGDLACMDKVVEHCEADVDVLADLYWKMISRVRNIHR